MYWEKKSAKHKKAKGARTSNESHPTVINFWLWSQRERKARGLGRVSLTQQRSSEHLYWSPGKLLWKAAFAEVLFCLQVEVLFHCHFPGRSIVLETWSPGSYWDWDSLKAPGPGSCVLTVLLSVSSFFFFFLEGSLCIISPWLPWRLLTNTESFQQFIQTAKTFITTQNSSKKYEIKENHEYLFCNKLLHTICYFFTLPLLIVS